MTPLASVPRLAVVLAGSLAVAAGAVVALGDAGATRTWGEADAVARAPAAIATTPVSPQTPVTGSGGTRVGFDLAPEGAVGARAGPGASARASPSPSPRSVARWQWPLLPGPAVVRPFRAPRSAWGAGHRGLDLAARAGAPVLAVEAGRVSHAGVVAGRGTVSLRHRDGLLSTYEPVRPGVAVGDDVSAGQTVGVVEPGAVVHCGAIGCLHLGARRGAAYVDPWPFLAGGEIALLPLR